MTTHDALVGTLPGVRLENDTHVCEITRFGAHVASWRVKRTSDELLFRSKLAKLDGTKAIRGGVPVCFPQFSDMGPCAQSHGFARTSVWAVEALSATEVTMVLRRGDEAGDGDAFDDESLAPASPGPAEAVTPTRVTGLAPPRRDPDVPFWISLFGCTGYCALCADVVSDDEFENE